MFDLREYQADATEKALDFFINGKKKDVPIVVAPTAGGKSLYVGYMAKQLVTGILVLQPSLELLQQNYAKYIAYGGKASIYSASAGSKEVGPVTFATIGSIVKNPELFSHIRYVIIDECHLVPPNGQSMYMKFFAGLKDVKVVGLTATAFRLKKYNDPFTGKPFSQINLLNRERPRFFNKFLFITQVSELYGQGYLSPVKYIPMEWSNGDLKVNTTGAEYTDKSMDAAMKLQKVIERLPSIVRQADEKGRKHRLVFVKNVSDAIWLSQIVPNSAAVHGETKKKERSRIIDGFKSGEIGTVFNVGVLTTGFDFPELDCVIMARPTMSLALYMQIIGRGIRLAESKEDCAFVDMCGNYAKFGKIEDIKYELDCKGNWILTGRDGVQLSGVRLDTLSGVDHELAE